MNRIRLLVVDDHLVVREGIRAMLAHDDEVEVVGEASNCVEAVQRVADLKPDVVLMDVRMPEVDGIEATRRVKEAHPDVAVVMLTMFDHDLYVMEAVRAGAVGYLLKDTSRDLLLHTVRAARCGGTLIKSSLLRTALSGRVGGRCPAPEPGQASSLLNMGEGGKVPSAPSYPPMRALSGLTAREMEVLELLAQGQTNKEIGQALHIGELTVKKHVATIIHKLGAPNRSAAAVRAVQSGLVCPSPPS